MKYVWEASDVVAGQIVQTCSAKERWIIGYSPATQHKSALVSLSDGLVNLFPNKEDLARHLTEGGYMPARVSS